VTFSGGGCIIEPQKKVDEAAELSAVGSVAILSGTR
jgi:hypothetical protein